MEKAKNDNSSLWIAGAAAAVLGALLFTQKAKEGQAMMIAEENSIAPSESMVQNSISSEDEVDAAKDEAINEEDNGFENEEAVTQKTATSIYKPKPIPNKQVAPTYSEQNKSIYNPILKPINNSATAAPKSIDKQGILWQQRARNTLAKKQKMLLPLFQKPKQNAATNLPAFPLKLGSRNALVKALQQKLGLKVDGIFGKITEATLVARFQIKVIANAAMLQSIINSPKLKATIKKKSIPKKQVAKRVVKRPTTKEKK